MILQMIHNKLTDLDVDRYINRTDINLCKIKLNNPLILRRPTLEVMFTALTQSVKLNLNKYIQQSINNVHSYSF